MSLRLFLFPCIFLFWTLSGYVRCEPLTQFAQKVKDYLPDSSFDKLFDLRHNTIRDTELPINDRAGELESIEDETFLLNESVEYLETEDVSLKDIDIGPESRFAILTNLVSQIFTKSGILTEKNTDKMAKQYTILLKMAADSRPSEAFAIKLLPMANETSYFHESENNPSLEIFKEMARNRYRIKRDSADPCTWPAAIKEFINIIVLTVEGAAV